MKNINISDIIELHNSGLTIPKISEKLNCSLSTVSRKLRDNNISLSEDDEIDVDKLIELYHSGINLSEVAKYFNLTVPTIRYRIQKHGLKLKTNKVYFKPNQGQKFNRLEFIEEVESRYNKKYWKCRCECGNIKNYDYYVVIRGITKSCGCYLKDNAKNHRWTGYKDISGGYWKSLLSGAKKREIDFKIDIKYAWSIFEKQNKKCKLSDLPIEFETRKIRKKKSYIASLDRIDNSIGYVEGNIQWVVREINFMKNKMDEDKFIELCDSISKNKHKIC